MDALDNKPYQCLAEDRTFVVADETGCTVVSFQDRASADHTAALLNQVFARGFKAGFRAGRAADQETNG